MLRLAGRGLQPALPVPLEALHELQNGWVAAQQVRISVRPVCKAAKRTCGLPLPRG